MIPYAQEQAFNTIPPRLGNIIVIAVDSTSRGYDLSALLFNAVPANKKTLDDEFFLSITAETADVFFALDSAAAGTNTILDTTATSAGGTPALDVTNPGPVSNGQCARIFAGSIWPDIRIQRSVDKTLILKCASGSTATVRFWASSQSTPGVLPE